MGLDPYPWAGHNNDDNVIQQNMGKGKMHPLGPECEFIGKMTPTFCCCSESGSIMMAEMLTQILMTTDNHEVFDQSSGVPPFLLLDSHGSQFDFKFL